MGKGGDSAGVGSVPLFHWDVVVSGRIDMGNRVEVRGVGGVSRGVHAVADPHKESESDGLSHSEEPEVRLANDKLGFRLVFRFLTSQRRHIFCLVEKARLVLTRYVASAIFDVRQIHPVEAKGGRLWAFPFGSSGFGLIER